MSHQPVTLSLCHAIHVLLERLHDLIAGGDLVGQLHIRQAQRFVLALELSVDLFELRCALRLERLAAQRLRVAGARRGGGGASADGAEGRVAGGAEQQQ